MSDIHQIEKEIRNISHDLNQDIFKKHNSYTLLLRDLIKDQNTVSEVDYELELDNAIIWDKITSEIKMNFYRIIQEAINNINKHSKAEKAIISIVQDNNNLCLSITDNGIGFNKKDKTEGIGIENIRYRVKSLKGIFHITSIQNQNTSLNISVPI